MQYNTQYMCILYAVSLMQYNIQYNVYTICSITYAVQYTVLCGVLYAVSLKQYNVQHNMQNKVGLPEQRCTKGKCVFIIIIIRNLACKLVKIIYISNLR